jgi:hypothetical protein
VSGRGVDDPEGVGDLAEWYQHSIVEPGKQPLALLLLAFVVTFLFIRFSVRMIRKGVSWWPGNVTSGGLHIHHVVFGIVVMMAAGVGGFSPIRAYPPWVELFAAVFGCGAALVLDEFALVLRLKDVYWSQEGRMSVQAVFMGAALCGLLLLGVAPFGVEDTSPDGGSVAWGYATTIAINAGFVVMALLKGKVWTGVIGILVPLVALVGALRLARPSSPWARWRYPPDSARERRARAREVGWRARWVARVHRVQDALAGRPSDPTSGWRAG